MTATMRTWPRSPRQQRRSSRSVFERLYREHFDFVWAAVRRLGVAAAAVDDAVQDVFVTAFRKIDALDPGLPPRPWLYALFFQTFDVPPVGWTECDGPQAPLPECACTKAMEPVCL